MTASRGNGLKGALQNPSLQIGLWQGLGSAYSAEICAGAGFDWLLFDGEHAPNHNRSLLHQLQVVAAYPVHPVARVPIGEAWIIKQYLDIGFQSLLVPFVETAAQAKQLVDSVRYAGTRGVAPAMIRAARWGRDTEYLSKADRETCLLVQIETVAGFENLEEIAAVDGVDGLFVGPSDLSAAYGHLGDTGHPEMVERIGLAFDRIVASGKAAGTVVGTPEAFANAVGHGCRFVATGADVGLLVRGAAEMLARAREAASAIRTQSK